jgi:hypothetical protein
VDNINTGSREMCCEDGKRIKLAHYYVNVIEVSGSTITEPVL